MFPNNYKDFVIVGAMFIIVSHIFQHGCVLCATALKSLIIRIPDNNLFRS